MRPLFWHIAAGGMVGALLGALLGAPRAGAAAGAVLWPVWRGRRRLLAVDTPDTGAAADPYREAWDKLSGAPRWPAGTPVRTVRDAIWASRDALFSAARERPKTAEYFKNEALKAAWKFDRGGMTVPTVLGRVVKMLSDAPRARHALQSIAREYYVSIEVPAGAPPLPAGVPAPTARGAAIPEAPTPDGGPPPEVRASAPLVATWFRSPWFWPATLGTVGLLGVLAIAVVAPRSP